MDKTANNQQFTKLKFLLMAYPPKTERSKNSFQTQPVPKLENIWINE